MLGVIASRMDPVISAVAVHVKVHSHFKISTDAAKQRVQDVSLAPGLDFWYVNFWLWGFTST